MSDDKIIKLIEADPDKADPADQKTQAPAPLDLSIYPIDDKGRIVVPDHLMETRYKELPNNAVNESKTRRAFNGGILSILGGNPERDKEIQRRGAEALNAKHAQRQSFKETTEELLKAKAPEDLAKAAGLAEGATVQQVIQAAMGRRAMQGDKGAAEYIRDTAGEKPTERQEIANIITDADRAMIAKVQRRITTTSCNRGVDPAEADSDTDPIDSDESRTDGGVQE